MRARAFDESPTTVGLPAAGLDWTCRETMAHILDDLGAYAMQLSGTHGHAGYTPLMEFSLTPGDPVHVLAGGRRWHPSGA
ncbi:hypothetical protein NKG94_00955 [Micromonospora sp. M12]